MPIAAGQNNVIRRCKWTTSIYDDRIGTLPSSAVTVAAASSRYWSTDLGGADSLTLDKHAGVVKFVLAYDVLSTLPNWDSLRLLDSEVLGEHLLDRLHMRQRHYRSLERRSLRTLKRSR
jgi:hypothetical protein